MSTRANIIIKDKYSELILYRHSDGYPEGTLPTLEKFLNYVKEGKIRDDAMQAAGWLIIIGAEEYKQYQIKDKTWEDLTKEEEKEWKNKISTIPKYWKVGSYEPTSQIHGDIEYLYTVDLDAKKITCEAV